MLFDYQVTFLATLSMIGQTIPNFGRIEGIAVALFQVGLPIGIILFVLAVFTDFFPATRRFIGNLF